MTEAERLSKIVKTQEDELRRIRRLLGIARVAHSEFTASEDGKALRITVTCIGVDEYHFIEQCKTELEKVGEAIIGMSVKADLGTIEDVATGLPAEGAVSPE